MKGVPPMKWDQVKIKSTTPYRSHHSTPGKDRCVIVLDLPMSEYSSFRRIVETPHLRKHSKSSKK